MPGLPDCRRAALWRRGSRGTRLCSGRAQPVCGGLAHILFGGDLAAAIGGLATNELASGVDRDALATMLVALVGVIFLGLSAFRLGSLSAFISRPVLHGFAFGLAITIILKQIPPLLGITGVSGPIWTALPHLVEALPRANLPSAAIGLIALGAILALRRMPQVPGALLVIVGGIALGSTAAPELWHVALAGPVTLSMPKLDLPPLALLPRLFQLAAPIALILFAESWGRCARWRSSMAIPSMPTASWARWAWPTSPPPWRRACRWGRAFPQARPMRRQAPPAAPPPPWPRLRCCCWRCLRRVGSRAYPSLCWPPW
jgi:hypothetical protein